MPIDVRQHQASREHARRVAAIDAEHERRANERQRERERLRDMQQRPTLDLAAQARTVADIPTAVIAVERGDAAHALGYGANARPRMTHRALHDLRA